MRNHLILLAMAISLSIGSGASAQGIFDLGPLSNSIRQSGAAIADAPTPEQAKKAETTDFTFPVSDPLRAKNTAKFVEGIRGQDPEAGAMLAGQDLIGTLSPAMETLGLKPNDMADAYTMWLMSVYGLYRGIEEDATTRQVAGTRRMVAATMAGSPELLAMPATEKQKFAEAMVLQALLNSWLSENLKQAPDRREEFQREFYRVAKEEMGVDLDRFDYGADGLYAKPQ